MSQAPAVEPQMPLGLPRPPLLRRVMEGLRPSVLIANIPGPIFQKEVWISGRKSGTYWIRFLYAVGLLLLVMMSYFSNFDSTQRSGSASLRLQMLQSVAPAVTLTILWFQLPGLMLAGAIFGAPSICEEKRSGTLATLLTTPLKAYQIVIGKTSAFFVQVLILTLIAAPLLLAIRVFGGVSAELVVGGMSLALSVSLLAGLTALQMSIRAKRAPSAMVGAIVMVVLIQGIVPLVLLLIAINNRKPPSLDWLFNCSAPAALGALTAENFGVSPGPGLATRGWIFSTLYTLGWCGVMALIASASLRRVMAKEAEGGSVIPKGKKVKKGKKGAGTPVPEELAVVAAAPEGVVGGGAEVVPGLRKKRRTSAPTDGTSRTVSDYPVMWREVQQPSFKSRLQMWLIILVLAVVLLVLYYKVEDPSNIGLCMAVGIILTLVTMCSAAAGATGSISGERESRTWEALLTTPMSSAQIVAGKVVGAMRRQWFIPAVMMIHFVIAVVWTWGEGGRHGGRMSDGGMPFVVLVWLVPLIAAPVFALSATGLYFSAVCRKSVAAAASNVGLALGWWAMVPILIGIIFQGGGDVGVVLVTNPVGMVGVAISGAMDHRYDLFTFNNRNAGEFALVVGVYVVFHMVVGLTAMAMTRRVIRRQTARAR